MNRKYGVLQILLSALMLFLVLALFGGYGFSEKKTDDSKKLKQDVSEHFFIDCYKAFALKEFSTLREFYDKHTKEPKPDKCFRLNNNEFLVTVTNTGRIAQGLYLIDIKQDKIEMEDGYLPNIKVVREFLGKNKKRYVLLSFSNLHAGYWSNGHLILNLVPRTNKGKPYILYSLLNVSEDPVAGLCGEKRERFIKEGQNAETINSYEIQNVSTEDITLLFFITEEDCKTLKKRTYTKKFKLADGIFKLAE